MPAVSVKLHGPLARQLTARMNERCLSANALARAAGTHANAPKDILAGRIANPRLDTVAKLAVALHCTVGELLEEIPHLDPARLRQAIANAQAMGLPVADWPDHLPGLYRQTFTTEKLDG